MMKEKEDISLIEQQKLLRVFNLIKFLRNKPHKSITSLKEKLETTARTTYRYLKLLKAIGLEVVKDEYNLYYIESKGNKEIYEQFDFTVEENLLLKNLVIGLDQNHPLRKSLLSKITHYSELESLAKAIADTHLSQVVDILAKAMRERRKVLLKNYHSIKSRNVTSRVVAPLQFMQNYTQLQAYEIESEEIKNYNLERIEDVDLLDKSYEGNYDLEKCDAFGLCGVEEYPVKLKLSLEAYHLLQSEFPATKPDLKNMKGTYFFEGIVRRWRGIGRFALGLGSKHIEVVYPEEFKEWLRKETEEMKWL